MKITKSYLSTLKINMKTAELKRKKKKEKIIFYKEQNITI